MNTDERAQAQMSAERRAHEQWQAVTLAQHEAEEAQLQAQRERTEAEVADGWADVIPYSYELEAHDAPPAPLTFHPRNSA